MNNIKIHILHTGTVITSPYLPFGGDCGIIKASGITTPKRDRIEMPVSVYLIEHPKGLVLIDTGWNRDMSPNGVYDRKAQIKSLGSVILYHIAIAVAGKSYSRYKVTGVILHSLLICLISTADRSLFFARVAATFSKNSILREMISLAFR